MKRMHAASLRSLLIAGLLLLMPLAAASQFVTRRNDVKKDCSLCHDLHNFSSFFLLKNQDRNALCRSCHDPGVSGGSSLKVTDHMYERAPSQSPFLLDPNDPAKGNYRVECVTCHNPHFSYLNKRGVAGGFLNTDPAPGSPDQTADPVTGNCSDSAGNQMICNTFRLYGRISNNAGVWVVTPQYSDTIANCNNAAANSNSEDPGMPQFDPNLIVNFGFEERPDLTGWSVSGGTATIVTTPVFSNGRALQADNQASPSQTVSVTTGKTYYLTAYVQEDSVSGATAQAKISWRDGSNVEISAATGSVATQSIYRPLTLSDVAPAGAVSAIVTLLGDPATPTTTFFWDEVQFNSTDFYSGCRRMTVAGRRLPLSAGGSTYNDWITETKPFRGVCNLCHTRTEHHRNNDDPDTVVNPDHTHHSTNRCTECHDHSKGFSKNQRQIQ